MSEPLTEFEERLIKQIQDAPVFRMETWRTDEWEHKIGLNEVKPEDFDCGTACCMAGHIEQLDPVMAAQLYNDEYPHSEIAKEIYQQHTGKPCLLDFNGIMTPVSDLSQLTREDAIAHIRNENPNWPQRKPR